MVLFRMIRIMFPNIKVEVLDLGIMFLSENSPILDWMVRKKMGNYP